MSQSTNLGELIAAVYEEFLEIYGDEDIASVAAAAVINDMLAREAVPDGGQLAAA